MFQRELLAVAVRTGAMVVGAALISLVPPLLGFAGPPEPRYTTLVVEYVGEQIRYIPPVVISVSSEESDWYRQHLWPEPWGVLTATYTVPASVLDQITESPLLEQQLGKAKPSDDEPKTLMNVRFTAGVGHKHVEIMVSDQTSTEILKEIDGIVARYSDLQRQIQEIADQVNPPTFHNVSMGEIKDKAATEAGFRTKGWSYAHFGFTVFKTSNGNAVTAYGGNFGDAEQAARYFDWKVNQASQVLSRETLTSSEGKPIGYRYRAEFAPQRKQRYAEVMWVVGAAVHWIDSSSLEDAVELEGQYRYGSVE